MGGCGADRGAPTPSGPSGSLGVVSQTAADRTVAALCDMLAMSADREALTSVFENRAHEELHVIAAATQERERAAAGAMLVAKERVEADLARAKLPDAWRGDTAELLRRTRTSLAAIGLRAAACPAAATSGA